MIRKLCFSAALIIITSLVFGKGEGKVWAAPASQVRQAAEEPVPTRPLYDTDQLFSAAASAPQAENLSPHENEANVGNWSKIVWQSYRDNNWEIYIYNWDTNKETRLTQNSAVDVEPRLTWDCTRIVFSSDRTISYNIFSMTRDGSDVKQLTNTGNNTYPAWSPDGKQIVFQSDRDNQTEIYVMNADGSSQTRLTNSLDYDGQPAWSPDGSKIAFVSKRTGAYRIYVMNVDGSGVTQVSDQAYSAHPTWSPDGSSITYDADGDGDGWQELWLMNTDGANQRQLYKPAAANTDVYAGSWRPGSEEVLYTSVSWIFDRGIWYWSGAIIEAAPVNKYGLVFYEQWWSREWYPDYQSQDRQAPVTHLDPIPSVIPHSYRLNWSADDHNGSGIPVNFLEMRDGLYGDWTTLVDRQNTEGEPLTGFDFYGLGGHTYYFRLSAFDNSGNMEPWPADYDAVTTVEALPPKTSATALPEFSRGSLNIQWGGVDPGDSGIQGYDIQYKDGANGAWTDWLMSTTDTSHTFTGVEGHTYYFRCRGLDTAQNLESWPDGSDGDTHTTIYTWSVSGTVTDNHGVPLSGVKALVSPGSVGIITSDAQGHFSSYATTALTYTVSLVKEGYGSLPVYQFDPSKDGKIDAVLPPADNVIRNGDFDDNPAMIDGWQTGGTIAPALINIYARSGKLAARLGQPKQFTASQNLSESPSVWSTNPQMAIDGLGRVTLVFWENGLVYSRLENGVWSPKQLIANTQIQDFMVFAELSGAVDVVYMHGNKILYINQDNAGNWSIPFDITGGSPAQTSSFRAALDPQNQLHVIWVDTSAENQVYYSIRKNDGTWVAPLNVSPNADSASKPEITLDKKGIIHLIYQQGTGKPYKYVYRQRSTGGAWSPGEVISGAITYDTYNMVCDEEEKVEIIAGVNIFPTTYYFLERKSPGQWTEPMILGTPDISQREVRIFSSHGKIYVLMIAWANPDNEDYKNTIIEWIRSENTWQGPIDIIPEMDDTATNYDAAMDNSEGLHLAWLSTGSVNYISNNAQGDWNPIISVDRIDGPDQSLINVDMVVGQDGSDHVAWSKESVTDGEIYAASDVTAKENGSSQISQQFTIPVTMTNPTLSLVYHMPDASTAPGSWFDIRVSNGVTESVLLSTTGDAPGSALLWFDFSAWSGQTVTLNLATHQGQGMPYIAAYLDEISLGSSYPDVWINVSSKTLTALPGSEAHLALTYGNRGGVSASGTVISATLPADLVFESASIAPTINGNTLSWQVDNLPAGSGPQMIEITARVKDQAAAGVFATSMFEITCQAEELEKTNNTAQAATYIGEYVYAPLLFK